MALRHERDTNARPRTVRPALLAAPVAVVATAAVVALGVSGSAPAPSDQAAPAASAVVDPSQVPELEAAGAATAAAAAESTAPGAVDVDRAPVVSRSMARQVGQVGPLAPVEKKPNLMSAERTSRALERADTKLWTTTDLNVWSRPGANAEQLAVLEPGTRVLVTGRSIWDRVEIVRGGRSRWVTAGYLATEEPVATGVDAGLSMQPCASSAIEGGLTDSAVRVYRAICNAFPSMTTYGGWDDHGEHVTGKAIDVMVSDDTGTAIAEFLRANAAELDLYNVIWRQRIFTQERAGEGWRAMSDRGSATANHYDHVHVSTY